MHSRDLIDLAALVTAHAPVLVRAGQDIPDESIEAYWIASKCRLDGWCRTLKRLSAAAADGGASLDARDREVFQGLLEEILASEVLTRVWTATMCLYDRARGANSMEPVARSIFIGHMEARHRVLTLLVSRIGLATEEAMRLDAMRSRTERWSDLLLGYLAEDYDVEQFAVDSERVNDFADDFAHQRGQQGGRFAWPLVLASLRSSFRQWLAAESPNPESNTRIAASILACFPSDVFDGTGLVTSPWLLRISHISNEAEGMLDALLAEGPTEFDAVRHESREIHPDRWRRLRG